MPGKIEPKRDYFNVCKFSYYCEVEIRMPTLELERNWLIYKERASPFKVDFNNESTYF